MARGKEFSNAEKIIIHLYKKGGHTEFTADLFNRSP